MEMEIKIKENLHPDYVYRYKRWPRYEKINLEREYITLELSVEEIAKIHNRTENSIRLMASRLGFNRPLLDVDPGCFGKEFDPEKCLKTIKENGEDKPCIDWLLCCNKYYRELYGAK